MSNRKLHIIQKQLIDITLPNATAALEWEASKRRDFTALINKQLEKCFDDYDKNGDHLVIEKLDIDLGVFTMNNLQEEVSQRLYSKLYNTLQEHSKTAVFTGSKRAEDNYAETASDRFYSGQEGRLEALFHFLTEGRLPWWGSELAGWNKDWLTTLTENEVSRFKNFIARADERPIRRLAIQFSDGFIEQLLQRFGVADETATAWQWLETLLKNLEEATGLTGRNYWENTFQAYQKSLLPSAVRAEYWATWISNAVGKSEVPTLHKLFNSNQDTLEIIYSAIKIKYANDIAELYGKVPSFWEKVVVDVIKQPRKRKDGEETATINKQLQAVDDRADMPVSPKEAKLIKDKELLPISLGEKAILSKLGDKKSKSEEETIFVNNAGLIILHPFLAELFRHCGWLEKNRFINVYTQTMAVYALHYLATGETVVPEHQLMFPKFLAGVEWEALLEPVELLNDKEQAACNELLGEVLKHWKPLRNTSLQGLREAYLQRDGKLEHIYSGWHLSIEQKTLDVLLSRLPWGISMIKLPWMAQPLTVAWQ